MDILFCRNKTWHSRLIRWMTWSRWSHVAIQVDPGLVVEAVWPAVRLYPLSQFSAKYPDMVRVSVSLPDEEAAIREAYHSCGKPYDVKALFGFVFRSRKWSDPSKWFCSELAAHCAEVGGRKLFRDGSINRVSPGLLWILNYSNK